MNIYKRVTVTTGYIPGTRVFEKSRKVEYSATESDGFEIEELVISTSEKSISAHFAGEWEPVAVQTATETRFSGDGNKFPEDVRRAVQAWLQVKFIEVMAKKSASATRADEYAQEIIERM